MRDFAAIDFETANNQRSSICSVGVVVVRGGEIVDSFYSLVHPEPNYYNYWCSQVHGLCHRDTDEAELFPHVWSQVEPLIEGLPLVAHNKSFDESCLRAAFRTYRMEYPDYDFYDTLRCFRNSVSVTYVSTLPSTSSSAPCISSFVQHSSVSFGRRKRKKG